MNLYTFKVPPPPPPPPPPQEPSDIRKLAQRLRDNGVPFVAIGGVT